VFGAAAKPSGLFRLVTGLCADRSEKRWRAFHRTRRRAKSVRLPEGNAPVRKTIPGTFAAYSLLVASGLFVVAAFAGALWLTGESAIWLGHALPRPLL
jgi:hypothetical protein